MEDDDKESIARRAWLAKLVAELQGDRSQQDLADLLGVTRQTIGDYTGRNEDKGVLASTDPAGMDIRLWDAFAQMKGVTVDDLYRSMRENQEVSPDPKQIDRSLLRRLVSASIPTRLAVLQTLSSFFLKPQSITALEENSQDLALVLPNLGCDNHHQSLTEVCWMVRESALKEFRRSLDALLASTEMDEILEMSSFTSAEQVLEFRTGDRLPTVQELRQFAGLLRKPNGELYRTDELFDLFNVPKKARLTARRSDELKV